jgi:group I intron endonuclease
MIIYKLENTITGKVYIGKTVGSLSKRLNSHKWSASRNSPTKLAKSIRKHGIESFVASVVEQVESITALNEREIYWIEYYDSYKKGLNSTTGGDGGDNSKHIDYRKRKNIYTDDLREKRRKQLLSNNPNYMTGVREKISQSKLGHIKSKEWVKKIVESKRTNGNTWAGEKNPKYVEVTQEQVNTLLANVEKVKYKKELVELTGLSYFMINKFLKKYVQ